MVLKDSVASLATRQMDLFKALNLSEPLQRLAAARDRADDKKFRILFVGEYSRGKSSLINALVKRSVLATSAVPISTQNVVRYGSEAKAKVQQGKQFEFVSMADLPAHDAARVEVALPVDWLRDRIELIEQPSASEQPQAFETAALAADLVVVVLASDALYSSTESKVVNQLKAMGHRDLWFVCSFYDRLALNDREDVEQAARVRLPVNPDRIFFVSAEQALEGQPNEAGLTTLRERLVAVSQHRAEVKRDRVAHLLQQSLAMAQDVVDQRDPAQQTPDLEKRQRELRLAYETLTKTARRLEGEVEDYRQRTSSVIQTMSRTFVLDLAPQMAEWLRQYRSNYSVHSAQMKIRDLTQQWHSQVLVPYWQRQTEQQSQTLQFGVQSFTQKLDRFYALLESPGGSLPSLDVHTTFPAPPNVRLPAVNASSQRASSGLVEKGIVLVPLTAGALILFIAQPIENSVLVGAACLLLAAAVGKKQIASGDQTSRDHIVQDYARAIERQADPISLALSSEVNGHFQTIQNDLHQLLSMHLTEAQQQLKRAIDRHSESSRISQSIQNQLESIKQDFASTSRGRTGSIEV